ncbi:DUF2490 domain-containing protein [Bacteroidota bacterium]
MNKILFITLTLLFTNQIFSQNLDKKSISYTNQQWSQYYNSIKVSKKWSIISDYAFRWRDSFEKKNQFVVRAGMGYQANGHILISPGIAYVGYYNNNILSKKEIRPHQDVIIKHKYGALKTAHRFRFEERFIHNENTNSNSFVFRLRYRIMLNLPIIKNKLSFTIGDEIFANIGNDIVYNVFSKNRLITGFSYKASEDLSVTMNYNNQFGAKNSAAIYQQDHVIWLGIKHKIDLTKS